MRRKSGPLYDFWHPRIEGQMRDLMQSHPEWFTNLARKQRGVVENSAAKRIAGEIAAAAVKVASHASDGGSKLSSNAAAGVAWHCASDGTACSFYAPSRVAERGGR